MTPSSDAHLFTFAGSKHKGRSHVRTITHTDHGLTAVIHSLTGADSLDRGIYLRDLGKAIGKPLGYVDDKGNLSLPDRLWGRVSFVVDVLQYTQSFTGDPVPGLHGGFFDIPSVDASDEDKVHFYDFVMGLDELYIEFFKAAIKKITSPAPNPTGAATELPSQPAPQSVSLEPMAV